MNPNHEGRTSNPIVKYCASWCAHLSATSALIAAVRNVSESRVFTTDFPTLRGTENVLERALLQAIWSHTVQPVVQHILDSPVHTLVSAFDSLMPFAPCFIRRYLVTVVSFSVLVFLTVTACPRFVSLFSSPPFFYAVTTGPCCFSSNITHESFLSLQKTCF